MNNIIYAVIIGIVLFVALIAIGCWINVKKQKELREKLKFKAVFKE